MKEITKSELMQIAHQNASNVMQVRKANCYATYYTNVGGKLVGERRKYSEVSITYRQQLAKEMRLLHGKYQVVSILSLDEQLLRIREEQDAEDLRREFETVSKFYDSIRFASMD